jgi:hypothetical protein
VCAVRPQARPMEWYSWLDEGVAQAVVSSE